MRKTARPVVWEGDGAQSPSLDPISSETSLAGFDFSSTIHPTEIVSRLIVFLADMRIGAIAFTCVLAIGAAAAQSLPEKLIDGGHWKKARAIAEARLRADPREALANFLLSQIRNAFGDRESPLVFAEKAVSLDGGVAKYHRQVAEVLGVKAQHSGMLQPLGRG